MAPRLNAPYGARCFLTECGRFCVLIGWCLNAPYGARCFLTCESATRSGALAGRVLMHLMALGAF